MKHLIIIGPQMSGKTLLGEWLHNNLPLRQTMVEDELTKSDILYRINYIHERPPYRENIPKVRVFITNEEITYNDVDRTKFLIIKLVNFIS